MTNSTRTICRSVAPRRAQGSLARLAGVGTLKELVRCYDNLVDDSARVMLLRLKAIYRGRAIGTSGKAVYRPSQRKAWLAKLKTRGARTRAQSLLTQLDTLTTLPPRRANGDDL